MFRAPRDNVVADEALLLGHPVYGVIQKGGVKLEEIIEDIAEMQLIIFMKRTKKCLFSIKLIALKHLESENGAIYKNFETAGLRRKRFIIYLFLHDSRVVNRSEICQSLSWQSDCTLMILSMGFKKLIRAALLKKDISSQYKIKKHYPKPHLKDMVEVVVTRGQHFLTYKTDFNSEDYYKLDFVKVKAKKGSIVSLPKPCDRGIKSERKEAIIKNLLPVMPANRHNFWLNLTVNEEALDLRYSIDDL
ncbi:hypothetical protein ABEB36_004783 [Hypothenemus hampei]|uniref:Uncharacterized protein n=1 Tax=Hypothenemus hampei TaxID=57062 RepID=A0ABD1EVU8_HYPHA